MKTALKIFLLVLLLNTLYQILNTGQSASALTMSNSSYYLRDGNFNSIAGTSEGSGNKLDITVGETGAGFYSGANYNLRAGFIYMHNTNRFTFTLSSTEISFGTLDPTYPVDRNNFLTVTDSSANGYQVTAQENHALLSEGTGKYIPNTTCDNGLCTSSTSDEWRVSSSQSNTFGFGYRCDNVSGTDCPSGFTTSDYFKQFAASPSAAVVMTGNSGQNKRVQITYRVNVAATQEAGTYTNQIQYIATPTF